ncbi:DUF6596 domain-containing protein [Arthrobacter sp. LAPM80]|uniref:DUF6596 domain-containing protein n=1 Tax=Arthrobacter sp. LAPM80 TaxID=3141788 RepID=UPI00398ADE2B
MTTVEARAAAERIASASHGRLVALTTWPIDGVPEGSPDALDFDTIGDKRLELLFVCAHPAVRTPLMLQTVLGFDASRIGAAFAVLEAVYGCHTIAWQESGPQDFGMQQQRIPGDLRGEAPYLAVTLSGMLRTEPEAWGLAALITLALARAPASSATDGAPLEEQVTGAFSARGRHPGGALHQGPHRFNRLGRAADTVCRTDRRGPQPGRTGGAGGRVDERRVD